MAPPLAPELVPPGELLFPWEPMLPELVPGWEVEPGVPWEEVPDGEPLWELPMLPLLLPAPPALLLWA